MTMRSLRGNVPLSAASTVPVRSQATSFPIASISVPPLSSPTPPIHVAPTSPLAALPPTRLTQPNVGAIHTVSAIPVTTTVTAPPSAWQQPDSKVVPADRTNAAPASKPTPPPAQNTQMPMWKKIVRVVVLVGIAIAIAIPVTLSRESSKSTSTDNNLSTPTPTARPTTLAPSPGGPTVGLGVTTILNVSGQTTAIAVATDGTVYRADLHTIYRLNADGSSPTRIAGSSYGYQNGPALNARFASIEGLAFTNQGDLLVSDGGNWRLRRVVLTSSTPYVDTVAGDGRAVNCDSPLLSSSFRGLSGIAVDSRNQIYVADNGDSNVRQVKMDANSVTTLPFIVPFAISVTVSPQSDDVYVSSGGSIVRIRYDGTVIDTVAGSTYTNGYLDDIGTAAQFRVVGGLAFSPSGNDLYITDMLNNCIRKYSVMSKAVTTMTGLCGPAFGSTDGALLDARFGMPKAIAVGTDGTIYVADSGSSSERIRAIKLG